MDKIKHIIFTTLTLFLIGCVDNTRNSLEFHKSIKRIKLLNDDYYIKSVKIIACNFNTGSEQNTDTNFIELSQKGSRGGTDVSLIKMGEYYSIRGTKKPNDLFNEPCLKYIVKLKRFEIRKRGTIPDTAIIQFDSKDITKEINIFTSGQIGK